VVAGAYSARPIRLPPAGRTHSAIPPSVAPRLTPGPSGRAYGGIFTARCSTRGAPAPRSSSLALSRFAGRLAEPPGEEIPDVQDAVAGAYSARPIHLPPRLDPRKVHAGWNSTLNCRTSFSGLKKIFMSTMICSQTGVHALRALAYLTDRRSDRGSSLTEIADACEVAPAYLAKVLRALSRAGLLRSRRGVGGGFTLARDPSCATVGDVLRITDHSKNAPLSRCAMGLPRCGDDAPCPVHREWAAVRQRLQSRLDKTTLTQLATSARRWGAPAGRTRQLSQTVRGVFRP
jgi:Rrf2 family protein